MAETLRNALSVLLVLGSTLPLGYLGKPIEMGIAFLAGSVAAAFVNIDKIQRVKGAGFEAEMRKAVEEAYATTEGLRRLAKPILLTMLNFLTMEGRLGGTEVRQKHAFREDLAQLGKELGLADEPAVVSAHELFFQYQTWDHYNRFVNAVWIRQDISEGARTRLQSLRRFRTNSFPSELHIEAALGQDVEKLQDVEKGLLAAYFHYRDRRTLRGEESIFED